MPAPQQAAHSGQQLGKSERFDQIIIGPQLKAMHAVFYGIAGGQEQHGNIQPGAAHRLQDLPAVATGQHYIENQQ